jgi:hypothetical protein
VERTEWVTAEGLRERVRRLKIGTVTMALAAWGTVINGHLDRLSLVSLEVAR